MFDHGNREEFDDDDSNSSIDSEQALRDLLGGIGTSDLTARAWDEQSLQGELLLERDTAAQQSKIKTIPNFIYDTRLTTKNAKENDFIYDLAHKYHLDGRLSRPPVSVCDSKDLGSEDRGNILVATSNIRRGEVIYTEKKIAAVQINGLLNDGSGRVRACENCFRSLEPKSRLDGNSPKNLPLQHLWPIASHEDEESQGLFGVKPIFCNDCPTAFCSEACRADFLAFNGLCCVNFSALKAAAVAYEEMITKTRSIDPNHFDADGTICPSLSLPSAIMLATRILCALSHQSNGDSSERKELGSFFQGFCGDPVDIQALEIGIQDLPESDLYSIRPIYDAIHEILSIHHQQASTLISYELFCKFCAMAARNGFEVSTKSPFSMYYSALMRVSGGWGCSNHQELIDEIAAVLGSSDGLKNRDNAKEMDKAVQSAVVPSIAALFPLTARINHSCTPCAEVMGQQFVDSYIDLIATRDIQKGEEITISYINVGKNEGKKSTLRRRNELQARYLFLCHCSACSDEV